MDKVPPAGAESYAYLQNIWHNERMEAFAVFLRCYNKNDDDDAVSTLETMQKSFELHHNKAIDMLKVGCTRPVLASSCLHKSTDSEFSHFTETNKDLLEKYQKLWLVDRP